MTSKIAAAAGVLFALVGAALFPARAGDHAHTIEIVGTSGTGYLVRKNTTRFEVDYPYRTTFSVTSSADVPLDFQIDGLFTSDRCRIDFEDNDTSAECRTKRTTIKPGATAVVFVAYGMALPVYEYYMRWWDAPLYQAAALLGPVEGTLAPADPDLELERDVRLALVAAWLLALLSFAAAWLTRRSARSRRQ